MCSSDLRTHAEREQVQRAVEAWRESKPDALALDLESTIFAPALNRWVPSYAAHQQAMAVERAASDALDDGDGRFDAAARAWLATLRDEAGRSRTAEITTIVGMAVSEMLKLPPRDELVRVGRLFAQQGERPDLRGDEARLGELQLAAEALGKLVKTDEEALRAKLAAGQVHAQTTAAFDRAYRKLLRTLEPLIGREAIAAAFPRFQRTKASTPAG